MKEYKKNPDNNVHVRGFINDVRINKTESGRTAINLLIGTTEQYTDKVKGPQTIRTSHDATLFTENKELVKKFEGIADDLKANDANREVEGYKPKVHTISAGGPMVMDPHPFKDMDKTYERAKILLIEDSIDLDVPQAKEEKRNRIDLAVNIGNVTLHEDKQFAIVSAARNLHKEGVANDPDWIELKVSGKSPFKGEKEAYEKLVNGDLKKGDFIRVGGMLKNNNFEVEIDGKKAMKYGSRIDVSSVTKIQKKQAQAETKEAEVKKTEKTDKKKVTSRRKKVGQSM